MLIAQLDELIARLEPRRIVELGIYAGGSVAMIAAMAEPERMVAIELAAPAVPELAEFLDRHGLAESVRPHYGVDQADSVAVGAILDRAFGPAPLDLVLDDASHRYEPSRVSFVSIFPRLREGGVYVIEDWAAQHTIGATVVEGIVSRSPGWEDHIGRLVARVEPVDAELAAALRRDPRLDVLTEAVARVGRLGDPPLSRLGIEILLLVAATRDIVRRVEVTQGWVEIERGAGEISGDDWFDRGTVDLFGSLADPSSLHRDEGDLHRDRP